MHIFKWLKVINIHNSYRVVILNNIDLSIRKYHDIDTFNEVGVSLHETDTTRVNTNV